VHAVGSSVRGSLFPAAAITRQALKTVYLKAQTLSRAWLRNALLISPASLILYPASLLPAFA